MNWTEWLYGMFASVIGGVASAVTAAIVSPETFNLETGKGKLATICAVNAVWCLAMYLKQSPLPPRKAEGGQ